MLDHSNPSAGALGRCLDRREGAEEPKGLALAGPDKTRLRVGGDFAHLFSASLGVQWCLGRKPRAERRMFPSPASGDLSRTRVRASLAVDNAGMASPHWSVDRVREEIELLGTRGLPRDEYFAQLAPRLRRVIDNDASCWHTLDPQTRLMTSDAPAELVERGIFTAETAATAGELLVRSEYLVQDSNTFAEL